MEVVVVHPEAFQILNAKIDRIQSLLQKSHGLEKRNDWISNAEFCKLLGIATRTAQNYRDKKLISFSQIGPKIYYKSSDVEAFMLRHHIKSTA